MEEMEKNIEEIDKEIAKIQDELNEIYKNVDFNTTDFDGVGDVYSPEGPTEDQQRKIAELQTKQKELKEKKDEIISQIKQEEEKKKKGEVFMEKEKILDKMRELRDVRDLQILSKELENINLDVDYKKDLAENKVLDVKYLGQIEQNVEVDGKEEKVEILFQRQTNCHGCLV